MRVDVYAQSGRLTDAQVSDCTAIVVDVLRASSTIITAIENGATQVIPTVDAGEAAEIAGRLGNREAVLGGERGGVKLPGFHFGNSPLEYTKSAVGGRTVIFTTTNGTVAIHNVRNASNVYIGAMRNRTAVARKAIAQGHNITIQCAGTEGAFSLDDICAAGAIADAVGKNASEPIEYNDLALCALTIYRDYREGRADISACKHYKKLQSLGFDDDLAYCFTEDTTEIVPTYEHGVIVKG